MSHFSATGISWPEQVTFLSSSAAKNSIKIVFLAATLYLLGQGDNKCKFKLNSLRASCWGKKGGVNK